MARLWHFRFPAPRGHEPSTAVAWMFEAKKSAELCEIAVFGRRLRVSFVAAMQY